MSRLLFFASRCLHHTSRTSTSAANLMTWRVPSLRNAAVLVREARKPPPKRVEERRASEENGKEGSSQSGDDEKPDLEKLMASLKRFFAISLFTFGIVYMLNSTTADPPSTTWSDFVNNILPTGQIQRIVVIPEKDIAFIYMYPGAKDFRGNATEPFYKMGIPSVPKFENEVRAAEMAIGLPPEHWTAIQYRRVETVSQWFTIIFLAGLLIGGIMLFRRLKVSFNMKDIMSNMTKAKYTIIDPHSPEGKSKLKIKFKDVAGCYEPKQEIREFVDYLKNPTKYTKLGAKLPRGALLTGPPGCGKTLLAKALAAESTVPFISMNGSEFVEVIGGLGASRIRGLFKEARQRAPCIIYVDEIDAIGRKRSEGKGAGLGGGSGEEEQTLNQLLVEMDGMGSGQGIVVLASTNRPDILDKALLRPGRFDRHINIDLPTVSERKEMFDLYLKRVKLEYSPTQYSLRLARRTPGMSGADINNVVNEAAIRAASIGKKKVTIEELDYSLDRILAGAEKRSRVLVDEEREVVAYHEAGHALVGWLLKHTDALLKVTIIPRTSAALGFAQYNPRDKMLFSKEELFDRMCMMLGGRCAENVKFGRITTGAEDDLKKEANLLVGKAFRATDELIRKNADKLEIIAQALLKREVLNYDDVKQLIGAPPHGDKHVIDQVETALPNDTLYPDPSK